MILPLKACVCWVSHSAISDPLRPPWTVAHQSPLSIEFSRQEYWSGFSSPSPGDLPDLGVKPGSAALQADSLLSQTPGKTSWLSRIFAIGFWIQVSLLPRLLASWKNLSFLSNWLSIFEFSFWVALRVWWHLAFSSKSNWNQTLLASQRMDFLLKTIPNLVAPKRLHGGNVTKGRAVWARASSELFGRNKRFMTVLTPAQCCEIFKI